LCMWLLCMRRRVCSCRGNAMRCKGPAQYNLATDAQDPGFRFQMTLWAIVRSPLFIGLDLRQVDAADLTLLTNDAVLAVNSRSSGNRQVAVSLAELRSVCRVGLCAFRFLLCWIGCGLCELVLTERMYVWALAAR
jgi:hypothetical protein